MYCSSISISNTVRVISVFAGCCCLHAATPQGWFMAGSKPAEYEAGIDKNATYNDHSSAYLKANENPTPQHFGTLMQQFRADQYKGKRVRITANIKTDGVENWAGMWMRVDKDRQPVAFDNMNDKRLEGTTGWQSYQVILDVPDDATLVSLGVLLNGKGTVWINGMSFDVVPNTTSTTGHPSQYPDAPVNLTFDKE